MCVRWVDAGERVHTHSLFLKKKNALYALYILVVYYTYPGSEHLRTQGWLGEVLIASDGVMISYVYCTILDYKQGYK